MSLPYSQAWYDTIRATIGDQACRQLGIYVIPADFLLSVVVPAYNEQNTLKEIVRRVAAVPVRKEIIIVDDRSGDDTWNVMQQIPAEFDSADNRIVETARSVGEPVRRSAIATNISPAATNQ